MIIKEIPKPLQCRRWFKHKLESILSYELILGRITNKYIYGNSWHERRKIHLHEVYI